MKGEGGAEQSTEFIPLLNEVLLPLLTLAVSTVSYIKFQLNVHFRVLITRVSNFMLKLWALKLINIIL
jgi:hypothetical protein